MCLSIKDTLADCRAKCSSCRAYLRRQLGAASSSIQELSNEHQHWKLGLQVEISAWQEVRSDAVIPKARQDELPTRTGRQLMNIDCNKENTQHGLSIESLLDVVRLPNHVLLFMCRYGHAQWRCNCECHVVCIEYTCRSHPYFHFAMALSHR
jgi:hypothetical protein